MLFRSTNPAEEQEGEEDFTSLVVPSNFCVVDLIKAEAGCPVSPYHSPMQRSQLFTVLYDEATQTTSAFVLSGGLPLGL